MFDQLFPSLLARRKKNFSAPLKIGGWTINDAHDLGRLNVAQVIQKSSNVGTAKLALNMPAKSMWDQYMALGFGHAPQVGFPGAVAGRVRP